MMKYYVLVMWGDIEPDIRGPYNTPEEADAVAASLPTSREDDGVYSLQASADDLEFTGSYGADDDDEALHA